MHEKSTSIKKPENHDTPGALPRHCGAPITIVLYYLNRVLGNTEESHAPQPPLGAGLAQDGQTIIRTSNGGLS